MATERPIRGIFFDAGNTLLYPRVEELAQELTDVGFPATVADFHAAERLAKKKFDEWLWPLLERGEVPPAVDRLYWTEYLHALMHRIRVPVDQHGAVSEQVIERFRDIQFWSRVFPDTEPVLRWLRDSGYYLGVISNSVGTMEQQLNRVGLAPYFRTILDSAVVGVEKPHPEIFNMAIRQAAISPSQALFIGDTYATDVGGARNAGLQGVLIDRFGIYDDGLDYPRLRSLEELRPLLAGRGNQAS
ncbi:MAG TPA: HAD-IA family hydrolase [Terriglobia bacterium]|nr:HAD-IA family hydrolase [Terriglobia bacterium]